jgi:hypothetical protein
MFLRTIKNLPPQAASFYYYPGEETQKSQETAPKKILPKNSKRNSKIARNRPKKNSSEKKFLTKNWQEAQRVSGFPSLQVYKSQETAVGVLKV